MSPGNIRRGVRYCLDFFLNKREKGEGDENLFHSKFVLVTKDVIFAK